jgi:hypothetical protein
MNGAEFFMDYAGKYLLPPADRTEDAIADAERVLNMSLAQYTPGKKLRLSSCWMVITDSAVFTTFKAHPDTGFHVCPGAEFKLQVKAAAAMGRPFMVLELGKRSTWARDLFVSYDARAVRLCGQGITATVNIKEDKKWTS